MPGVCGRDFNRVWSVRKIQTGHSIEGLSWKGKTVIQIPNPDECLLLLSPLILHKAGGTENKEYDQMA